MSPEFISGTNTMLSVISADVFYKDYQAEIKTDYESYTCFSIIYSQKLKYVCVYSEKRITS